MASSVVSKSKPDRVTTIAGLRILAGVLAIGLGYYISTSTTAYLKFSGESLSDYESMQELQAASTFVACIVIIQGGAGIIIGLGMHGGKRWAWTANVVLSIIIILLTISDIASGLSRSAIGLIFNASILAYSFTRPVRAYFRKKMSPSFQPGDIPAGPFSAELN